MAQSGDTERRGAGVIYCTSGEKYFEDAVTSATSFKRLHPDLGTAIFRAEDHLHNDVFDHHLPLFADDAERDWIMAYSRLQPKMWMSKVLCSPRTPFRKTVHLDSDTYVLRPIDALFDDLDTHDLVFTMADAPFVKNGFNVGVRVLSLTNTANTGVYAFRDTPAALDLIGPKWRRDCEAAGFKRAEQGIITDYLHNPEEHLVGLSVKMRDNVRFNAVRRIWRTMSEYGLWEKARILHFGDTVTLRRLLDGEIEVDDLLTHRQVVECDPAYLEIKPSLALYEDP